MYENEKDTDAYLCSDAWKVVRTPEGTVEVDTTGKKNGKGAYLKLSSLVIQKARKNKALDRALEVEVPEVIYEELESMLKES